jgi:hypothetical protein
VNGKTSISWELERRLAYIDVTNIKGEQQSISILSQNDKSVNIDLGALAQGMYLVRIFFEDGRIATKTFVK